jgi:hypothetical protein
MRAQRAASELDDVDAALAKGDMISSVRVQSADADGVVEVCCLPTVDNNMLSLRVVVALPVAVEQCASAGHLGWWWVASNSGDRCVASRAGKPIIGDCVGTIGPFDATLAAHPSFELLD